MKLPSSSSFLLATLAISSSSSSLAAPAGENDAAITTSSSNHNISTLLSSSDIPDLGSADIDIEQRSSVDVDRSEVESDTHQGNLVSNLLELFHNLPIIGHPVASLIEKSFPSGTDSVQRMPVINADDLQALHAAIAEVSRVLTRDNQTLGASSAVQSVAPIAINNGNASNGFTSTSVTLAGPTTSSVLSPSIAAADGNTIATFISVQSSPPTPIIPGNPPNTPVPPAA